MNELTLEFNIIDEDGNDVIIALPAKYEVCPCCNGLGTMLNPAMRGHAYTEEEFAEEAHP